jgi:hypothetical protein
MTPCFEEFLETRTRKTKKRKTNKKASRTTTREKATRSERWAWGWAGSFSPFDKQMILERTVHLGFELVCSAGKSRLYLEADAACQPFPFFHAGQGLLKLLPVVCVDS